MTRITLTTILLLTAAVGGCASLNTTGDRLVRSDPICRDVTVPIYFEADGASVTPDGRKLLVVEANRARRCTVNSVRVIGLADAVGEPAANLELSKRRAAAVADVIQKAGLPAAEFDLAAAGQAGAVNAEGQVRPVRRRADVTLKLSKPK